jgi:TonB family protein
MNHHFPQVDFLSRRALAFSGIAAFHILIAYLLLTALAQPAPRAPDTTTAGIVLPTADPPPLPKVDDFRPGTQTGPIALPPLDPWAPPQDPAPLAPDTSVLPAAGGSAGVPVDVAVRTIGTNQLPNSEEYYPPDLRRLNVQGATHVRVCVDARGTRVGDPTVEESSGNARLDIGALNVARHGRYARSMQGEIPVGSCFRFRISFKITR